MTRSTGYNPVARTASFHWQGEALTPPYIRASYTAVHDVKSGSATVFGTVS